MSKTDDSHLSKMLYRFGGLRNAMPELIVSGLLINVLGLALPLALLQMYDRIIPNKSISTLTLLMGGVVAAVIFETLLRILRGKITTWLGARFEHRVSVAGLDHLTKVPTREFMGNEVGVYIEQLRATGRVRDFYSGQAMLVFLDLPFAIIYIGVIALIGGWLALVACAVIVLFITAVSYSGGAIREKIRKRTQQDDRRYNFLTETFRGVHSVKTMAMEPLMHRRYETLQEANVEQSARVTDASAAANNLGANFGQFMTIAVVAGGAYLSVESDMTPGALAACIMLANRSLQPLRRSLAMWIRFQSFKVARERLADLFAMPVKPEAEAAADFRAIRGGIDLKDVKIDFGAESGPLFEHLNLSVRPGECVAIMGASGSGKSTLMNLMAGVIRPDDGDVLIDGIPISRVPRNELDQRLAHLPQRGELIRGTILENVTMFDEELEDEAIRACEAVGLDRVVAGMRLGYETPVGDGAVDTIPAGVRQRIAIARELIFDPKIIVFDEANIAMDGEGDKALREYLENKKGDTTIVLVTHRPSQLRMADSFYKIDNGRLIRTDLEEHLAMSRSEERAAEEFEAEAEHHVWQLPDLVDHFPTTSDFALCLPALLTGLKWRGASRTVAESLPHLAQSLDLSGFRSIMATLGYESNSYRCKFSDLDPRLLPCLFVPSTSAARVVLDWSPESGYRVFDSETVSVQTVGDLDEFGEAFVFKATEQAATQPSLGSGGWTGNIFLRFKGFMVLALCVTILSTVLSLATPLFVMGTFNFVIPARDYNVEIFLLLGIALAFVVDWQLKRLKGRILSFMAGRSEYIIGNNIFQKILRLPPPSIERVPVAEQVTRVKDLEALRDFFMGPVATLAYELPATLIFVAVLAIINIWMLAVVLVIGAAYIILGALTFRPQARRSVKASRLLARRDEFMEETLNHMITLKGADATGRWLERFQDISGAAAMASYRALDFNQKVTAISQAISMLGGMGALITVSIGVMNQTVSAGAILASMMIMWRLTAPMQNAFSSAATIVQVVNSLRQIDNLMRLEVEPDTEERAQRPQMRGGLEFSRVSFRYSMNADPALLGLTFDIEPGEIVALAGPNGSGKSTLLKLLVRAYQAQAGSIRMDGIDIRQIPPSRLREEISYLPQGCEIFYGTIAQNLRLAHPTATEEDLKNATKMAGVYDEIMALEQGEGQWKRSGLDYRISESQAAQMPNGFRQKLALARAFLKPAPLMLFDEPGNGLDAEGEKAFLNALQKLRKHSTIILASHRPSHLKLADKVIYLEHGAVRTMGSFDNDNVRQLVMSNLG